MAAKKKPAKPSNSTYILAGHPHPNALPEPIRDLLQGVGVGEPIPIKLTADQTEQLVAAGIIAPAGEGP